MHTIDRARRARCTRAVARCPMAGRVMPRYLTDDGFYDDPAVMRAGTAAVGLYYRCGVYVARHMLDGHVPVEIAAQCGTPEWTKRLVDVGLFEIVPGGLTYYMPRYLTIDGNKTRKKIEAERAMKAERQAKWLSAKLNPATDPDKTHSRRTTRRSRDASRDTPVDLPPPPSLTGRTGTPPPVPADGSAVVAPPMADAPRRELVGQIAEQLGTRRPWCGHCDQATRLVEGDNGRPPRPCRSCSGLRRPP